MTTRPSMEYTLMLMTRDLSYRGTCPRSQVGCLVARDGRILSSGYNGAPAGMTHCAHPDRCRGCAKDLSEGVYVNAAIHLRTCVEVTGCLTAVHAEANALAFAARHGVSTLGATLYTTLTPCRACAQLIIQAGITRVVADAAYRDPAGRDLLELAGLAFYAGVDQVG